jgi:hypothetical protein
LSVPLLFPLSRWPGFSRQSEREPVSRETPPPENASAGKGSLRAKIASAREFGRGGGVFDNDEVIILPLQPGRREIGGAGSEQSAI